MGFYRVVLERFDVELPGLPQDAAPLDAVDNWSVGYLRPEGYVVMTEFARGKRRPELETELAVPAYSGQLALCVNDVTGRSWLYGLDR